MSEALSLIALVLGLGILYVVIQVIVDAYRKFRRPQTVVCPEEGREAHIELSAGKAALSAAYGEPKVEVSDCSLWPEREGCAQRCVHP